jgi:hypothetical protein
MSAMVASVSSVLVFGVGGLATEDSIDVPEVEEVDAAGGGADELAEGAVDCPHPATTAIAVTHAPIAIRCRTPRRGCLVTTV